MLPSIGVASISSGLIMRPHMGSFDLMILFCAVGIAIFFIVVVVVVVVVFAVIVFTM